MPYFPPAGGSVILPNSIDNTLLQDMPAGTLKGRAVGAGTGDPQDLTLAQLSLLLGTRHECRFTYFNATTCVLGCYGGNQLTIDAQLRQIPPAGISFPYNAGWSAAVLYVYAFWTGSAIGLVTSTSAPVADPRDGNFVEPAHADWTIVGMVRAGAGQFFHGGAYLLVQSFWNRRMWPATAAFAAVASASSTATPLVAGSMQFITWGDEAVHYNCSATASANGLGTVAITWGVNNVAQGQAVLAGIPANGVFGAQAYALSSAFTPGVLYTTYPMIYTVGGAITGTWTGLNTIAMRI